MNANASRTRQRRQLVMLGVLIAALVGVVGYELMSDPAPRQDPRAARIAAAAAANQSAAAPVRAGTPPRSPAPGAPRGRGAAAAVGVVEEVNLAKLNQQEPAPIEGQRNPFSLAPAPRPQSADKTPGSASLPTMTAPPPVATGPPPVPPPPPITLKFFGVLTAGGRVGKVAALGDGKFVYHGREGEIIEGRYRIVRIGEESIQLEYVDGRGRQTIRLSGK